MAETGRFEVADAIAGRFLHKGKSVAEREGYYGRNPSRRRALEGISYIPEDRQNYGIVMDFTLSGKSGAEELFQGAVFQKRDSG